MDLLIKEKKNREKQFFKENNTLIQITKNILESTEKEDRDFLRNKGFNILEATPSPKNLNTQKIELDDIENLCHKYDLKVLPINKYKGPRPADLAQSIRKFESKVPEVYLGKYFILAPSEQFDLSYVEFKGDPWLLWTRNDQTYYIVKKWGNDFNIFRRIKGFLLSHILLYLITSVIFDTILVSLSTYLAVLHFGGSFELLWLPFAITPLISSIVRYPAVTSFSDFNDEYFRNFNKIERNIFPRFLFFKLH